VRANPRLRVLCGLAIGAGGVSQWVEVHGDHQVAVIGLAGEHVTGHIALMEPLHDDHDRRPLIVQAVRHRLTEEPNRLLALQVALSLDDVVRIVEDDPVAALAGR
jgi:hypothetical protein